MIYIRQVTVVVVIQSTNVCWYSQSIELYVALLLWSLHIYFQISSSSGLYYCDSIQYNTAI